METATDHQFVVCVFHYLKDFYKIYTYNLRHNCTCVPVSVDMLSVSFKKRMAKISFIFFKLSLLYTMI